MRSRQPRRRLGFLLGLRFWAVLCLALPSIAFGKAPTGPSPLAQGSVDAVGAAPDAPDRPSDLPRAAAALKGEGEEEKEVRGPLEAPHRTPSDVVVEPACSRSVGHVEAARPSGLQPRSRVHSRGPPTR